MPEHENERLIECLADRESRPAAPPGTTEPLARIQVDLETLSSRLRSPAAPDPFVDEADCHAAVDRAVALAEEASQKTFISTPDAGPVASDADPASPADVSPGILGQYRLISTLGAGGMGTVYKAIHTKLERVVALKVLPAGRLQDPHAVSRFEREMRAVGKLHHPNIVAAHDAGEIDGTHYLVMELVEGRDLSAIVKDFHPLPIAAACEMIRQAALGLQHAHQHGLVHRDIKPSNLMLAASNIAGGAPVVKVLDLGLALLADGQLEPAAELTSTGQVMGTIDYMAPEQGTDTHKVDIRADIYSLGATLYKLLTGHVPFAGAQYNSAVKKLMALATKEPPAVTSLRPDCPPELASLVQQMLAKNPSARPSNPAAVVRALELFAQGADLRPLLTPSETDEWQAPPTGSTARLRNTDVSALDDTHLSDLAALPTARLQPAPTNRKPRRWLIALGAMGALIASAAVIFVVTDTGTVEIEMADDATDKIAVNVLRNGQPVIKDWEIRSTDRETRVRSGRIEVVLTGELADRFEIENPDDLHVSRGVRKIFTIRRRSDSDPGARGRSPESPATAAGRPTNGASPTSPPKGSSEFPDPTPFAEPPPLEGWLKGRTLLTVAQDGSGQFATIQAALQALKPGQAVHVLDRGPYRERLNFQPPDDTGLFSKVGTVVELESWAPGWKEVRYGHTIHSPHDFRISGLSFSTPVVPDVSGFCLGMLISQSDGFVLENCFLSQPASPKSLLGINWFLDTPVKPCVVRNCLFECSLGLNSAFGHSQLILERNLFQTSGVPYHVSIADAKYDSLVIRHNIFAGASSNYDVLVTFPNDDAYVRVLEITNNTSLSQAIPGFRHVLPKGDVRILNNLRLRPGLLMLSENAEREMPRAIREWHVGHNAYPRRIQMGELPSLSDEHIFPTPATDLLAQPGFASVDATHPDYLRIAAVSPLATAGAGNKWPAYMGALPPGPAPRVGDWFSKMRQQWPRVAQTPAPNATPENGPVRLQEPPPLAEWLKGRRVLTVSQDGRGEFSTIQAALNALQRHQVIQVLDRGPYRESLRHGVVPDDTGLISDAKTRLEITAWEAYAGHELGGINGFRLAGFEFDAPARTEWAALISWGNSPSGLIIEDCHFNPTRTGEPVSPLTSINLDFAASTPEMSPIWIRRCVLNSTVQLHGMSGKNATVVFEENLWHNYQASPYSAAPNVGRLLIRRNLLTTHGPQFLNYENASQQIEVSNNTILGPGSQFIDSAPRSGVTIVNNIFYSNLYFLHVSEAERDARLKNWHFGWNAFRNHNAFKEVGLPRMGTDFAGEPEFLSLSPKHADYLRIAADSPLAKAGAGGEWPNHIGALPPGPVPREGDWFTRLRERWLTPDGPAGNQPGG